MVANLVSVLIVEDDETLCNTFKEVLTTTKPTGWPFRYKVTCVSSLGGALKNLLTAVYSVVITDIKLPDSSGLETFWKLHEATDSPIIVLTGSVSVDLFERILLDGAYMCYEKTEIGLNPNALHHAIRHTLLAYQRDKLIEQQRQTITGQLKITIRACSACDRYYDELANRWVSHSIYFKRHGVMESHGHCPDCMEDYYGKDIRSVTQDYE